MTVFENIRIAVVSRFNRRFNCTSFLHRDRKILEESDKILSLIGMMDVRDVPASEMSYGMQRQLELALTLARDPILILLDEPTAGLNAEETRSIVPLIKKVTEGKTLVIVEHDMEVVFNLADRITVLNYGQVLATGTPISNTVAEAWTMLRYTRPDLLKSFHAEDFDSFAGNYGRTVMDTEETPSGDYKIVQRFARYVNGPEGLYQGLYGVHLFLEGG
jgi:ABC-type multidrug transport system ATPase subunit